MSISKAFLRKIRHLRKKLEINLECNIEETSYYGVSTKPHVFEIIGERAEIYITEIQQTITYSQSKEATDHSVASFLGFYYEII